EHYRFLTATATGPLVLRMPAGAGMPPAAGGAVDYSSLSLSHVDSYRIDFYAMPLTRDLLPQPPAPGQTTAETITIGGRTAPLVESAVAGRVDVVSRRAGALTVSGWAADLPRGVPADEVGLFAGGRLLAR